MDLNPTDLNFTLFYDKALVTWHRLDEPQYILSEQDKKS